MCVMTHISSFMPKGSLLNWSFKAQKAHENKVVQLLFYLSCEYDQGIKNVLFLTNFAEILGKGLEVSICTHTAHLKIFGCRLDLENHGNCGVLSKGSEPFWNKF